MINRAHFQQFNELLYSLVCNTCEITDFSKLDLSHSQTIQEVFDKLLSDDISLITKEWDIAHTWLASANMFEHDEKNHIHSAENPFGMRVCPDYEQYLICPHMHFGKQIVGGNSLHVVLREIATGLAFEHFDYVAQKFINSSWHQMEAIMSRQKFILSNEEWNHPVTSNTSSETATLSNSETPDYNEDGVKKYDANRLNKYDKSFDDAKVSDIMGAFGEALDEVLNRRDIKPADKEIRSFLGIGAADMSEGEKTYPGFYIPMALMAMDAIIGRDYNIVKTTNYETWSKLVKPIGFGMYQTALNSEQRLMHECSQFCEAKNDPSQKIIIQRIIHNTMSGPQLAVTCLSALKHAELYGNFFNSVAAWIKENNYYKGKKIDASGKFLNVGSFNWDNIILEPEIKDNIFDDVVGFLNYADLYKTNNLPFKRGLILYGKPGCGKTLLGKVVANQVKSSFVWITAAQAGSPSFIREIFGLAREIAPCVLFFEDIDMYTVDRGYGAFNSLVGELLAQMDGMEENNGLIVVATTNRLDVIEKALAERPSRFDRRYSLDFMSLETTEQMVKEKLGNALLAGISPSEVAKMVFGLNGCFIQEVIVSAKRKAISRGALNENGIAVLDKELLQESTEEVTTAFKIALDRLQKGELSGFLINNEMPSYGENETVYACDDDPVMVIKNSATTTEQVTLATARTPRNVNLTHPEKVEIDTELKDALAAIAKYSEFDDKDEIEDYISKERLNDHSIAVTSKVFDEIDWDNLNKNDLRKMFRLVMIRHHVVKTANTGFDPIKDRKVLGQILHAMDMLSDRYYWVHAVYRIGAEFGFDIHIPYNPYKDQTSKDAALKLYDILTGKVKTAKEREDAINKKNNVFVPTQQEYDMPDYKHNSPKVDNVNKPDSMRD